MNMPKLGIKPASPCKGCENRNADCHIDCIKYIAFKRALERYNKKERAIRNGVSASWEAQWSRTSDLEKMRRKNERNH